MATSRSRPRTSRPSPARCSARRATCRPSSSAAPRRTRRPNSSASRSRCTTRSTARRRSKARPSSSWRAPSRGPAAHATRRHERAAAAPSHGGPRARTVDRRAVSVDGRVARSDRPEPRPRWRLPAIALGAVAAAAIVVRVWPTRDDASTAEAAARAVGRLASARLFVEKFKNRTGDPLLDDTLDVTVAGVLYSSSSTQIDPFAGAELLGLAASVQGDAADVDALADKVAGSGRSIHPCARLGRAARCRVRHLARCARPRLDAAALHGFARGQAARRDPAGHGAAGRRHARVAR